MSEASSRERYGKKQNDGLSAFASMDPLSNCDRLKAIQEGFTSVARDCPFYCDRVRSRCLVDPQVIFIPECTGRSFTNGICCPKILQASNDLAPTSGTAIPVY